MALHQYARPEFLAALTPREQKLHLPASSTYVSADFQRYCVIGLTNLQIGDLADDFYDRLEVAVKYRNTTPSMEEAAQLWARRHIQAGKLVAARQGVGNPTQEGRTQMARIPAELAPLIDAAKKNGYKVVPSGRSKHLRVVDDKGRVVVDENGPVIVSGTPGDVRMRDMHVKRFIGAGIIKPEQDPWKPQKAGEKGPAQQRDEKKQQVEAARLHGLAEASRQRAERTRKIRARWEPIMAKLGGWDKRGMQSETAKVLFHYVKSRGRTEAPASEIATIQLIQRIRRGDTLSHDSATVMELFLDDLEKYAGDIPQRWAELLREAKGLPTRSATPEAGPPIVRRAVVPQPQEPPLAAPAVATAPPEPEYAPLVALAGETPLVAPRLAIDALALMMTGLPEEMHNEARAIARDILQLELEKGGQA